MSNLVIVAIPEEQDRVWKISSEKVPHLTLLFLGDEANADTQQIMQFVEHAVTLSEHGQFYLDVDRRGELGADNADVVFFSQRSWNLKWIKQFRSQLLQNQAVRTAYDGTEQFGAPQEWTPHLTLGYPDTPAKELPDNGFDHPLYSVCFDRIAVWAEDYNGPEFRLEWPDRELEGDLAIAYSDQQKNALTHGGRLATPAPVVTERGAEFVEHHGTKGMKWGVRNDRKGRDRFDPKDHSKKGDFAKLALSPLLIPAIPSAVRLGKRGGRQVKKGYIALDRAAGDAKFAMRANKVSTISKLTNSAAAKTKEHDLPTINAKYKAKGAKTHENVHLQSLSKVPVQQEYRSAVKSAYLNRLNEAAKESTSESGRLRYEIAKPTFGKEPSATRWTVRTVKVEPKAGAGSTSGAGSGTSRFGHAAMEADISLAHAAALDEFDVVPVFDEGGFIVDFDIELLDDVNAVHAEKFIDSLMSEPDAVEQFMLEHHGVKGMKWGVRNTSRTTSTPAGLFNGKPPKAVAPKATSKVPHGSRRKTKIETDGGENHPAHADAIEVAKSVTKLKKSGTKALSNKELQDLANRVRLEEQATQATRSRGSKWIRKMLGNQGNQAVNQVVRTEVDSKIRSMRSN